MKSDSNGLKIVTKAIEEVKKRLYELELKDNPDLTWKEFEKRFDSFNDPTPNEIKNKIFKEEMDKFILEEKDLSIRKLLIILKDSISFELIEPKKRTILDIIKPIIKIIFRIIILYILSVSLFGLFSYTLNTDTKLIFILSIITTIVISSIELIDNSITLFIYDPFLKYKALILYIFIFVMINLTFFEIFSTSIIWILFIPILYYSYTRIIKLLKKSNIF